MVPGLIPAPGRMTGLPFFCDRWSNSFRTCKPAGADTLCPLGVDAKVRDCSETVGEGKPPSQDPRHTMDGTYLIECCVECRTVIDTVFATADNSYHTFYRRPRHVKSPMETNCNGALYPAPRGSSGNQTHLA